MSQPLNVRIDERLIHGQVAALWTKALRINRIVVIDQEVVKNDMQKMLLKTACPSGIKLSIISPKRAADNFNEGKYNDETVMVIVKSPKTLESIKEEGFVFEDVNVGNITNKPQSIQVTNQIYVDQDIINTFNSLSKDTHFHVQLVPTDSKKDFMKLLGDL